METKNLTIMFTDMKGFTQKTSVGSRSQVEHLLDLHDNMIRPIFKQFGGHIVKTIGDAFLVTFESPTDAVLAGMKIQEAVQNHDVTAAPDDQFEMRIAINVGEVHIKNNDIFGEPVNIAARIESIAESGEVYFTEAVYLAMNRNEIPSAEVGQRHLKGIPEQIKVYKVLQEKTNLLRERIKRKGLAAAAANLPKDRVNVGKTEISKARPAGATSPTDKSQSWWTRNGKVLVAVLITVLVLAVVAALFIILRTRDKSQPKTDAPTQLKTQQELRDLAPKIVPKIEQRLKDRQPQR